MNERRPRTTRGRGGSGALLRRALSHHHAGGRIAQAVYALRILTAADRAAHSIGVLFRSLCQPFESSEVPDDDARAHVWHRPDLEV